jgi:hypothetical protein
MFTLSKSTETGSTIVVAGGTGMESDCYWDRISFWGDGNVLELDKDDGCTTL